MLQAIHDGIKGWLGAFVVAIIALPFAFWGIQSYIGGGTEQFAATVNDIEISVKELEYGVSRQRQQLAQQYQGQIPFDDATIKAQVLERLINFKLLDDVTHASGYRISDAILTDSIKQAFSRDGKFDREMFESVLRSQGRSEDQLMQQVRGEMRVQQMQQALLATSFITDEEVKRLAILQNQSREIDLIRFNIASFASDLDISEAEIKTSYETNSRNYMTQEKISIDYIELTGEQLSGEVHIDEQQVRQMYDEYVANLVQREKRKAAHILLKIGDGEGNDKESVTKQLEDIKQKIAGGASFSELAKKHSQDIVSAKQGGSLGWVEIGQMVKPFETALYAMKKGSVSDVVESQFGLHLIMLEDIKSEKAETFAKKRMFFEEELKTGSLDGIFYDVSEIIASTAYENPDSLDAVVDAVNTVKLEIKSSENFTRTFGAGISQSDKIRQAAFSSLVKHDGANSDVIELGPDHIVVLRMREHIPASLKPLQLVKQQIIATLKNQQGHATAMAAADEARAKLASGESVKSVLSKRVKLDKKGKVSRTEAAGLSQLLIEHIFRMDKPTVGKSAYKTVDTFAGEIIIVKLDKVNIPEKIEQSQLDVIKSQLNQQVAYGEFDATITSLTDSANIRRNLKVLQ